MHRIRLHYGFAGRRCLIFLFLLLLFWSLPVQILQQLQFGGGCTGWENSLRRFLRFCLNFGVHGELYRFGGTFSSSELRSQTAAYKAIQAVITISLISTFFIALPHSEILNRHPVRPCGQEPNARSHNYLLVL